MPEQLAVPVSEEVLAEQFAVMIAWTHAHAALLPEDAAAMQVCLDLDTEVGLQTITFTSGRGDDQVLVGYPGREVFGVDAAQFLTAYRDVAA